MAEFRDEFFDYVEEIINEKLPKRYIRDAINPLEFYEADEFRKRYRFTKDITVHIILPLISEQLQKDNKRGLPFSPIMQLLICLRYYATSSFQTVCGDLRGASQSTVSNIVKRCSTLLAAKCRDFVRFPSEIAEQRKNINKFRNYAGFPTVSGCIDCTHIKICSPGGNDAEVYRNRKGYFSLNVQVVAGPSLEIMDIVVRHPGSHHDSVIFDRSGTRIRFERQEVIGILLGDSGYPCRPYLLTPVLSPNNEHEERYNTAHICTRNLVERLFGVWKRMFPCLQKGLTINLNTSVAVICACAVLYNIHREHNKIEEEAVEVDNEVIPHAVNNNNIGLVFRQEFIHRHF